MTRKAILLSGLTFLLSFCSFGYQILIAFAVSATLGGSAIPWLLTVGAFLLGLGFGSLKAHSYSSEKLIAKFVPFEIAVAVLGGFSLWLILSVDSILNMSPLQNSVGHAPLSHQIIITALGFILSSSVGYFTGFELPILLKGFDQKILDRYSHWIIGLHYAGTLFAAVFVQAVILPKADLSRASIVLGFVSCALAALSIFYFQNAYRKFYLAAIGAIVFILSTAFHFGPDAYQYYLKIHYLQPTISSFESYHFETAKVILERSNPVERTRTRYQYIDLLRLPSRKNEAKMDTLLYLDTHLQFGSNEEEIYHELITHVPISVYGRIPKRVLITGGGDGLIVRELLRYKEIEQIDLVELDPDLLEMAIFDQRFTVLNHASLQDKRVNVMVDDAFQYLRRKDANEYDAIYIDFPFPHNPDLARLYSREFYQLAKRHLSPEGFIALDFPLELKNPANGGRNDLIFNTLRAAGFEQFFPFAGYDSFIAARRTVASLAPVQSDLISPRSKEFLKIRTDVLDSIHWNDSYVHSIFHPLSFGQGFE